MSTQCPVCHARQTSVISHNLYYVKFVAEIGTSFRDKTGMV